jgi:hypothetical protein
MLASLEKENALLEKQKYWLNKIIELSILHNSKIDVKTTGSNKDQAYMVAPF